MKIICNNLFKLSEIVITRYVIINQMVQVANQRINLSLPVDLKSGFPDNMG